MLQPHAWWSNSLFFSRLAFSYTFLNIYLLLLSLDYWFSFLRNAPLNDEYEDVVEIFRLGIIPDVWFIRDDFLIRQFPIRKSDDATGWHTFKPVEKDWGDLYSYWVYRQSKVSSAKKKLFWMFSRIGCVWKWNIFKPEAPQEL